MKTEYEQACEEALLWEIEAMRQRERERRTDRSDGFFKPTEEDENE